MHVVAEPASLPPLRILVVDDEPDVLSLISDLLTADGHTVEAVDDARRVLAKVAAAPFDVILSDMRMPGMGGPALHRALVETHPALAGHIAFMTGDTLDTDEFFAQVGAPAVAKPFTHDALRAALRAAMGGASGAER
jgi:CheY-like chemotaxis protein